MRAESGPPNIVPPNLKRSATTTLAAADPRTRESGLLLLAKST